MPVTRTPAIPNPTIVPVSPGLGEFLFFRVTAGGPVPRFRLASDFKDTILHQGMFSTDPSTIYEWTYLKDPSDIQQLEILTLALLFIANASYGYHVSVHDAGGHVRDVLDIAYAGTPTDVEEEAFRILIR